MIVPDSPHREDPARFARWALGALQIPVHLDEREAVVELPEADRAAFDGQQRVRLPVEGASAAGQESLAWDGRFGRWLASRLRAGASALHARPRVQPMGVNDIAGELFAAYQVDGGQVHMAGCQMTDHPFLRLSFAGDEADESVRHVFAAPDGSSVSEELVAKLGLDALEPIVKTPPRIADPTLESLAAAAKRIADKLTTVRDPAATAAEPLAVAVAWVRQVDGRLQFTIDGASASLGFSSWARLLKPPPLVGRYSGQSTFHLAATDDGRIDAADQIVACAQSGRRVLRDELVECSVTGRRVLPDFTERCPVSGKPTLKQEFAACSMCRQRVSKAVLEGGVCAACRSLKRASKDDPRLAWIFGEHPGLDRWSRWQLAETERVYVALATSLMKRLLAVVDKETLAVYRLATAPRLGSTWIDADEVTRGDLLK